MNNLESFYVTCGRGTEIFVQKELSRLNGIVNIEGTEGKVYFECSYSDRQVMDQLRNLKTVERLFLGVYREKSGPNVLRSLMETISNWSSKRDHWSTVRTLLKPPCCSNDEVVTLPVSSKRLKLVVPVTPVEVRFRISCKCAGKYSRFYTSDGLSYKIGKEIMRSLQWKADCRNPNLEITLNLNDRFLIVGFPVFDEPLSKRPYLKFIHLRTTICWALAYCANIRCGDVILDPMSGAGTVLVETSKCYPECRIIGVDNCLDQLKLSVENLAYSGTHDGIDLILGSVQHLPIKCASVDVILCDFPFGLKHGTVDSITQLLPNALKEMNRVLKIGGRISILISYQIVDFLLALVSDTFPRPIRRNTFMLPKSCVQRGTVDCVKSTVWWKQLSKNDVKLGNLNAAICAFEKRN